MKMNSLDTYKMSKGRKMISFVSYQIWPIMYVFIINYNKLDLSINSYVYVKYKNDELWFNNVGIRTKYIKCH